MNGRRVFGLTVLLALAGGGCSGGEASSSAGVDVPVHPGTCLGATCELPNIVRLEGGKNLECTPPAPAPKPFAWSDEPGLAVCPFGQCPLVPIDVAAAADGSSWGAASVLSTPDHPMPEVGHNDVGTALLRFDANGVELARTEPEIAVGLRRATELSLGMHATADGGVLWVGPGHGTTGVALRRYDAKGKLTSAHWLVEHARRSDAIVDETGAFVLYEYRESVDLDASPPEPTYRAGVARFDAHGRVIWNQSALASLPLGVRHAWLAGADAQHGLTVVLDSAQPKGVPLSPDEFPAAHFVRISPDGSIAWVRKLTGDVIVGAIATTDGKVVYATNSLTLSLHVVGSDGTPLSNVSVEAYNLSLAGRVDEEHVLLYGLDLTPPPKVSSRLNVMRAALDGSSCSSWQVLGPVAVEVDGSFNANDSRFAALPSGRVALTTIRAFGMLDLGGAP